MNNIKIKSVGWKQTICGIMLVLCALLISSCGGGRPPKVENEGHDTTKRVESTKYDFYIENSGSMAGYFNGDSETKTIINEYYDRTEQELKGKDTITLNYVNTEIIPIHHSLKSTLATISKDCKATYTKIDEILELVLRNYSPEKVAIVVSDFCFTSDDGNFKTAQSGVTKIFRKHIKTYDEFSVLIRKYQVNFSGKYYPGGLVCKSNRPLYVWIMGSSKNIKNRFLNIDIKEGCNQLSLQCLSEVMPKIIKTKSQSARMVNHEDNSINVSEWRKERKEDCYKVCLQLNLLNILLSKEDLLQKNNYKLSNGYTIDSIQESNGQYNFLISTNKPSPGMINISYIKAHNPWISRSNFIGKGVPPAEQTLGIQYLIDGVFDAYTNKEIFSTKIILK